MSGNGHPGRKPKPNYDYGKATRDDPPPRLPTNGGGGGGTSHTVGCGLALLAALAAAGSAAGHARGYW